MNKNTPTIVMLSLIGITMLSGIILASSKVSADNDSVTDEVSITVPVACTMGGSIATGNEHTATLLPGTYSGTSGSGYENGIGKTTLTVFCNDYNGFSIYAVGYTGDSMSGENHTKLVGTSASGNATIPTKVYESTDTTSNWSMKVDKITDSTIAYNPSNMTITSSFNSWHTVPDTYAKVAEYHATTGSSATDTTLGAKVETTYAAYISSTQPADTYTGKVKYTMVHPYNAIPADGPQTSTAGCISYHPGANDVAGTMGCQSATDGNSINLLASNFSRTGYGFAGWSDSYDYATNPSAHFYGPQETITVPEGTTANGLSLYAVWVKSEGSIQDQSKVASVCSSLTTAPTDGTANLSSVSALTDQRDNNTYAIAKLADGKCWMIENLRLDNTATLTLSNTNNPLNDGTNVAIKHSYSDTETYNTLSPSQDPTISAWCTTYDDSSCSDQSIVFTGNTTNRTTNPVNNSGNMYSYGNYYNWYSVTAGRGTYDFNSNDNSVAGDLCPAGWRLPMGGDRTRIESDDDNDFWNLVVDAINDGVNPDNYRSGTEYPYYMGSVEAGLLDKKMRSYPNNFLYSGNVFRASLEYRGIVGYYWTSTVNSAGSAYGIYMYKSDVYPGTNRTDKIRGISARCIAGV